MRSAVLVVAAALYGRDGRILIAQRPPGKHMAGRWEFPGGKVEPGESEAAALARELREELGIEVTCQPVGPPGACAACAHPERARQAGISCVRPFMRLAHSYNDRDVELSMWIVDGYQGEPQSLDGQGLRWVEPARLADEDILEADRPFVEALQNRACTINPLSRL